MSDLISRKAAIDAIRASTSKYTGFMEMEMYTDDDAVEAIEALPSAQPEIKPIDYQDCANAMMKMWMDNVLTDGEYNRIMDKLNKHEIERRKEHEKVTLIDNKRYKYGDEGKEASRSYDLVDENGKHVIKDGTLSQLRVLSRLYGYEIIEIY